MAASGGRARMMPRSLLRQPAAWGGSVWAGCDASNASGRGGWEAAAGNGQRSARTDDG